MAKPIMIYTLFAGELYGTEKNALQFRAILQDRFDTILAAPEGPLHDYCRSAGIESIVLRGWLGGYLTLTRLFLRRGIRLVTTTTVAHTWLAILIKFLTVRSYRTITVVNGGASSDLENYRRKRLVNFLPVTLLAVSEFVKAKLMRYGVRERQIRVIENWLNHDEGAPVRSPRAIEARGVILVSRCDPVKKIDRLFDLIDFCPELSRFEFHILGAGHHLEDFRRKAEIGYPNVCFHGFQKSPQEFYRRAWVYLHLADEEPFGLSIIEAMRESLPVIIPRSGGPATFMNQSNFGLFYDPNDLAAISRLLLDVLTMDYETYARLGGQSREMFLARFTREARRPEILSLVE